MWEGLCVESVDRMDLLGMRNAVIEVLVAEGLTGCAKEWSSKEDVEGMVHYAISSEDYCQFSSSFPNTLLMFKTEKPT